MFTKFTFLLLLYIVYTNFQLSQCVDEGRIDSKALELSALFPQEASLTSSDIEKLSQINSIVSNSGRPFRRRLNDIRKLSLIITRERARGVAGLTDEQIWGTQEPKFKGLIEKNDRLVKRLQESDVTEEVRELDDEIQSLFSRLDMYKNGRFYAIDVIKSVLRKASEETYNRWEEVRDEIYGDDKCPEGFTRIHNSCFVKLPGLFIYDLAVKSCKVRHPSAHLPKVDDQRTNDIIFSKFGGGYLLNIVREKPGSENFVYADSRKTPTFFNWRNSPQEPNNAGNIEDCVQIIFGDSSWNDNSCTTLYFLVCQTDLSPRAPSRTPDNRCPAGFEYYYRSCYAISNDMMNHDKAVKYCHSLNPTATLPIIANKQENDALIEKFGLSFHLDIMRENANSTKFIDTFKRVPSFIYWGSGEPNNAGGKEGCASISWVLSDEGAWNDIACDQNENYALCQIP